MVHQPLDAVLRHIRKIAGGPQPGRQNDQELLQRFIDHQDESAFTALVQRHGPMVRGVCWRVLRNQSEADDAFQATFLVLLRKARSICKQRSLGSWLYGVAFRTALRARTETARRQTYENQARRTSSTEPGRELAWRELCAVLDEEVQQLSGKYRAQLILCYLEGRTRDEAAHHLGCSLRTLQRRLERGREILRSRLTRRGLTLPAGLLVMALSEQTAAAALPTELLNLMVKAALPCTVAKEAAAGLTSGAAAALAKGVLRAMFISKLIRLAIIVLAVAVTGTGAGLWTYHTLSAEQADTQDKKAVEPAVERGKELPSLLRVPSQRDGIVLVIGTEIKEGEKVSARQTVTVKVGGEEKKYRRLKKGDTVEEGQLLARLDDDLARAEVAIKTAKLAAAEADRRSAEAARDEALARYNTQTKLYGTPKSEIRGTTLEDLRSAKLTFERFVQEVVSKTGAIEVAKQELNQARKMLAMHEIRSPSRGVITSIANRPGEAVKFLETVFLIQVPED